MTFISFVSSHRPFDSLRPDAGGELIIGGLVLGSAYLAACIFSIPAILLGKGTLWALKALNWGLLVLVVATLLVSLPSPRRERRQKVNVMKEKDLGGRRTDISSQVGYGSSPSDNSKSYVIFGYPNHLQSNKRSKIK